MRWISFDERRPAVDDGDNNGFVLVRYTMRSGFHVMAEYFRHAGSFGPIAISREWLEFPRSTEHPLQREFSNIRKVEL